MPFSPWKTGVFPKIFRDNSRKIIFSFRQFYTQTFHREKFSRKLSPNCSFPQGRFSTVSKTKIFSTNADFFPNFFPCLFSQEQKAKGLVRLLFFAVFQTINLPYHSYFYIFSFLILKERKQKGFVFSALWKHKFKSIWIDSSPYIKISPQEGAENSLCRFFCFFVRKSEKEDLMKGRCHLL